MRSVQWRGRESDKKVGGILEDWNVGMMEIWNSGVPESCTKLKSVVLNLPNGRQVVGSI
jgi:hypothetical protein